MDIEEFAGTVLLLDCNGSKLAEPLAELQRFPERNAATWLVFGIGRHSSSMLLLVSHRAAATIGALMHLETWGVWRDWPGSSDHPKAQEWA